MPTLNMPPAARQVRDLAVSDLLGLMKHTRSTDLPAIFVAVNELAEAGARLKRSSSPPASGAWHES